MPEGEDAVSTYDAIVIGAGAAGIYALHRLRESGLSVRVLDGAGGVGGVWYWNRYPGARCDVPSLDYSYSFSEELDQEWTWTERFASQPEIEAYLNYVADRFDLRKDIQLNTYIDFAHYDEAAGVWHIGTREGERFEARYCVMATGMLSAFNRPHIDGAESFEGEQYDTGRWPHEPVDLKGKRVGVIGTGSTGIQLVSTIAPEVEQLVVFQRTPNFSLPGANRTFTPEEMERFKAAYPARREEVLSSPTGNVYDPNDRSALEDDRERQWMEFESRWGNGAFSLLYAYNDLMFNAEANAALTDFMQAKIREKVDDPEVAADLVPTDYPAGAKRMCVDTGYYETFNRENVRLVNLRQTPIEEITPSGIRTGNEHIPLDVIVYATGFDAFTGALTRIDVRGRGGQSVADAWTDGPRAYLGLMVSGFPNMFVVTGPGSPSVLSNVIHSSEQHVNWMADCIDHAHALELDTIEADATAEQEWMDHVQDAANQTVFVRANSWYLGSNIEGKARQFMAYVFGTVVYRERCEEIAADGYRGLELTRAAADPQLV